MDFLAMLSSNFKGFWGRNHTLSFGKLVLFVSKFLGPKFIPRSIYWELSRWQCHRMGCSRNRLRWSWRAGHASGSPLGEPCEGKKRKWSGEKKKLSCAAGPRTASVGNSRAWMARVFYCCVGHLIWSTTKARNLGKAASSSWNNN